LDPVDPSQLVVTHFGKLKTTNLDLKVDPDFLHGAADAMRTIRAVERDDEDSRL
jgi:hypothetical protein